MGTRPGWRLAGILGLALGLFTACDGGDSADSDPDPRDGGLGDGQVLPDGGRRDGGGQDGGARDGGARDGNVEDDGRVRDATVGVPIESCEDVCDRHAACDKLQQVFGDEESCLRTCGRIFDLPNAAGWRTCVSTEACGTLHLCRHPNPPPLTCDGVCAALDECGSALPGPGCDAVCAGLEGDPRTAFLACGESLATGACGVAAFQGCVAERVFPECGDFCGRARTCNLVGPECTAECIARSLASDPLARLRLAQRSTCARRAGESCEAMAACLNPGQPVVADRPTLCRLWNQCGFERDIPCDDIWGFASEQPGVAECVVGMLQNGCPPGGLEAVFVCFEGGGVRPSSGCAELCEARDVCGLLGNERRPECVRSCEGAVAAGTDLARRLGPQLACGTSAETCDDLRGCLERGDPRAICTDHCRALAACGRAEDLAACVEACDTGFARERQAATRACVAAAAGACNRMAACTEAPGAPCAAFCARAQACNFPIAGCAGVCDDAHFQEPGAALGVIACVLTAPACRDARPAAHTVASCLEQQIPRGQDCLGFCRADVECAGGPADPEALGACLTTCGTGLEGDDALRFGAAQVCLLRQPPGADCAAVGACVPDSADVDCGAACDRAGACGVPVDDCLARCADDPLGRLRALQREACLAAAGADCAAVRACWSPPEVEPALPPTEAELCGLWNQCQLDFEFPCREAYRLIHQDFGPQALACVADRLRAGCPRFGLQELFEVCLGGGERPRGDDPACVALCQAREVCGQLGAGGRAACLDTCNAALQGDPEAAARVQPQIACGAAPACPALSDCLADSDPRRICERHCDLLGGCGLVLDGEACVARCDADFARLRAGAHRSCVAGALGCEAIAACTPPSPPPCGPYCERLAGCGFVRGDAARCVAECDDTHFRDPVSGALSVACVLRADACFERFDDFEDFDFAPPLPPEPPGAGEGTVAACLDDPRRGAGECVAFCRAVGECAGPGGMDLGTCLTGCISGYTGADALRFAAARACAEAAGPDAACGVLRACVPAEIAVDCPALCGTLAGCGVPADGCEADCVAEPDVDLAGCVVEAQRLGRRCAGVAECARFVPPAASPACRRLCEVEARCDADADPFVCRLECTPEPAAVPVQAGCAAASGCGDLPACLALGPAIDPDCVAPCAAAAGCGAFPDAAACEAECTGMLASPFGRGQRAGLAACVQAATAPRCAAPDVAAACFAAGGCELADVLRMGPEGGRIRVDTSRAQDRYQASCGGNGPEQVIALRIAERSRVSVRTVDIGYDTLIFARSTCDDVRAELGCNDDFEGLASGLDLLLAPGIHYIFIDGFGGQSGVTEVDIRVVRAP